MKLKHLALAAGALLISGTAASAAVVTNPLHLRAGPGTHYQVIDTMPQGARVAIRNCTGSWCRVNFRGETGWASASYLGQGRSRSVTRTYRTYPAYGGYGSYAAAPVYGGYYSEGPSFGIGIGPAGVGIGFGPGYGYGYHPWRPWY